MRVEGSNGSVEFLGDRIIIRRKGLANVLTQGVQGDKTIPLSRLTAVQFRHAGSMMAGLIQFTIQGGREFRGGMMEATKDENAVMFTREQEPEFAQLREQVEAAIMAGTAPASSARSEVDDIAKLAELHEKGYLTKEEFDARKQAILSPSSTATTTPATIRDRVRQQGGIASEPVPQELPTKKRGFPWWGWILVILGVLILLSKLGQNVAQEQDHGEHWRKVGELGGSPYIRFVQVDAASAHDGAVYRDAAEKVCGANTDCWQLGIFLPGDQIPSGDDKAAFFRTGGWSGYAPAAVWTTNEFTKWDCEKAGADDAPLSALCSAGAKEQYDAILNLATRVGWTTGCHLPATKDRELAETFASRQNQHKREQLMQAFDQMEKSSESGPDDPADCQNLRSRIEQKARDARKVLNAS